MAQTLEFSGRIESGRLPRKVSEQIAAALRNAEGKSVVVSIREVKRIRSLNQNSFYHGPFIDAFRQCLLSCGQRVSPEDIHAGLRDSYAKNSYTIALPDGQIFRVPPSTARLSTSDFEAYLEEIRAHFATEYEWQLPFPNEP
jgi:hypothetical protein